jgi:hypothetical protein
MQQPGNSTRTTWPEHTLTGLRYSLRDYASELCDLDINFQSMTQPELATRVVANCLLRNSECVSEDEIWSWSLKKRLQALLAITIATHGRELLLHVRCANEQCGEEVELPLDLTLFIQDADDEEFEFDVDSKTVTARVPNGTDQQQWMRTQNHSAKALARKLILRVGDRQPANDWDIPEDWLIEFNESLMRHDELMTLKINSNCPFCSREFNCAVDLETQLLVVLSMVQQKILHDVHQIALAYHWSEAEIVRLTPARRNFYLSRIRDLSDGATLQ